MACLTQFTEFEVGHSIKVNSERRSKLGLVTRLGSSFALRLTLSFISVFLLA